METQKKKWYNRWWVAMLVGFVAGWLLKHLCYMDGWSGINL